MVERIKVSEEVAKSLELLKALNNHTVDEIICISADPEDSWIDKYSSLNELSVSEIAHALIVGYEVELTLKEKLLKLERAYHYDGDDSDNEYRAGATYAAAELVFDVIKLLEKEGIIK